MEGDDIKKLFPTIFQGLRNLGEEFKRHLKTGATPHTLHTRACSITPTCQEELDRMKSMGVILKVDQPTPLYAGMMVLPKWREPSELMLT